MVTAMEVPLPLIGLVAVGVPIVLIAIAFVYWEPKSTKDRKQ